MACCKLEKQFGSTGKLLVIVLEFDIPSAAFELLDRLAGWCTRVYMTKKSSPLMEMHKSLSCTVPTKKNFILSRWKRSHLVHFRGQKMHPCVCGKRGEIPFGFLPAWPQPEDPICNSKLERV